MAMMALGLFVFSIPTLAYNEMRRRTEWRHARTPRFGVRDATQFLGVGEETISLSGRAFSEIADPEASLDMLRDMAGQGEPWPLVCASGRHYGSYVIVHMDEGQADFWPNGAARAIDFGIELLCVDDDQAQAAG